jgi:hypothetical protein
MKASAPRPQRIWQPLAPSAVMRVELPPRAGLAFTVGIDETIDADGVVSFPFLDLAAHFQYLAYKFAAGRPRKDGISPVAMGLIDVEGERHNWGVFGRRDMRNRF